MFWRQSFQGKFWFLTKMAAQVEEERDEEVSNEAVEDSEYGPILISKLEVTTKEIYSFYTNPLLFHIRLMRYTQLLTKLGTWN